MLQLLSTSFSKDSNVEDSQRAECGLCQKLFHPMLESIPQKSFENESIE